MKEKKTRRGFQSLLAGVLAFVLAFTPVFSSLPAIESKAAGMSIVWNHAQAGASNGNSHSYEDASQSPAAVLLNQSARMPLAGEFSTKVRFENEDAATNTRFAMFYTYQDVQHWIYVGYDSSSKWYYQYQNGSAGDYGALSMSPSVLVPETGKEYTISVSLSNETLQVRIVDGTKEYTSTGSFPAMKTLAESINGQGRFGFRMGKGNGGATEILFRDVAYTGMDDADDAWAFLLPDLGSVLDTREVHMYDVTGKVKNESGQPVAGASVRMAGKSTSTGADGSYRIEGVESGTYTMGISAEGYMAVSKEVTVADGDLTVEDVVLPVYQIAVYDTYIASSEMRAAIDESFPRVMQYEMLTGPAAGKAFLGQENEIHTIRVNNHAITPVLNDFTKEEDHAVYKMSLTDSASNIDLDMEVTVSVKENDLTWAVTNITKKDGCVKINTIDVPELNLVTINDSQSNAEFKGAVNSSNVSASGDTRITFDSGFIAGDTSGYGYGFISGNGLSAGLWSNSEKLGDLRVTRNNGSNTISLTSAPWYYEYGDAAAAANYEHTPVSELPCTKVCITPDLNEDGVADWQDGAIAYRDIMNNPYGSEDMPELVNYRIVMNLGSLGTNPFMKTADNVKKVYLATDGLGQAIMLKGFGNEGHDSANSEYGGIAERLGGAEDMKRLNAIAHQYNTEVGIHVNANEAYPEAQTFSEELIQPDQLMNPTTWGWMDKSYEINKIYDLGSGLRYKRFLQLYDQLNDTSLYANKWPGVAGQGSDETVADEETIRDTVAQHIDNPTNMDFIYLDVWYQNSWESRKIAQQVNSLGWRFSTEFGTSCEYDSTWQHWATEGHYGGGTAKGNNSEVMRFIRNHQRDSFVLNYPEYGGEADNPLLGHYATYGFEGWCACGNHHNFTNYITETFTENLPARFLQHYLITKWVDYTGEEGDVSPVGSQTKEITLKSADGADTVVVTRNEEQRADQYIERTITLNGKKILDDVTYLLPWEDSETGEEKLYHWNYDGGTTTWELQDDWKTLANVVVYPLSDQGRGEGQKIDVVNGSVTLDAAAKTAYVVTKGEEAPKTLKADFGEGAYVTDPGFNGYAGTDEGSKLDGADWSGDIEDDSIRVKKDVTGNQNLVIDSPAKDVAVSTKLNSLIPGQKYVAEIYVDNRAQVKAAMEISGVKEETVSNYTLESLALNYAQPDAHNSREVPGSRMQEMMVSFTAESDTATLTLKREAGSGITYFDDIRIVPKAIYNFREDGTFVQDFESVVQGYYPFVLGAAQNVTDPVTHLSELHEPYTQSGWGTKILDDVISGKWSLKHHGANTGVIYRTIPQTFHFEAGKKYEISFDYQSGSADSYCMVVGEGNTMQTLPYLEKTTTSQNGEKSWTEHFTFEMVGAESGQSWFGLYGNGRQEQGELGQRDFILDNLEIRKLGGEDIALNFDKSEIILKGVNGTEQITASVTGAEAEEITYASTNSNIATVDQNGVVTPVAFGDTKIMVMAKADGKTLVSTVDVTVARNNNELCTFTNIYANTEETEYESGGKDNTVDGNPSTQWHTQYSGSWFAVSESNPAVLTYELAEGSKFNRIRFQQRAAGPNGLVSKYQLVWGTAFDQAANTVSGGASLDAVTVTNPANGQWVDVSLDGVNMETVKYLQLRILGGGNGYGSIAEFEASDYEAYTGTEPAEGAVDKSELVTAINQIVSMDSNGLSESDLQKRNDALEEAKTVMSSSEATAEQVTAAIEKIADVDTSIKNSRKEELQTLLQECQEMDTSEYTAHSVAIFENAIKQAQQVTAKTDPGTFEVNNALYTLQTAKADLAKAPETETSLNSLNQALTDAEAIDSKLYTAESYAKLETAMKNARKVLSISKAAKWQIENALSALNEAVNALEVATDPAKEEAVKSLNQALTEAKAVDSKLYTAESYAALQKAVSDAEQVLKDSNATKEQIDSALAALRAAIGALKKADEGKQPTPTPQPDDSKPISPQPAPQEKLKKGDSTTYKAVKYVVLDPNKKTAAAVKGTNKKATKVIIAATVTIKGEKCKVTQVKNNAFKNFKRLKSVVIGKNVKSIGKKAFLNCKKLNKVTFKGKKSVKIGKQAFRKTNAKLKVKVPKKMKKKQRRILMNNLKKAGANKRIKL